MNCCPPCRSSGSSLAGVAAVIGTVVIADRVCVWVADRIWWIGGLVVVSFALAVAISMWLESLAERCGARFAERHGIRSRADVIQVEPVSDRKVATYLSPVAVPAARVRDQGHQRADDALVLLAPALSPVSGAVVPASSWTMLASRLNGMPTRTTSWQRPSKYRLSGEPARPSLRSGGSVPELSPSPSPPYGPVTWRGAAVSTADWPGS
jgi:hypothetical protein